ncbi:MAG: LPXTG cell wall anchor domain-containing protein [bacterium]
MDCYIPEDCQPTPTPVPPPFLGCLEGSGGFGGSKSGPGCGGFSCSLQTGGSQPSHGAALAGLGLLGLLSLLALRKRHG